ncbi:MerR family transcriptional regulator [Profundibacterium mesophilum]|uniref:MerR-type HTH domain containing protein n=1 Tax=Profundibacterium mesophilum KAUST100406-0324 TaxID=1037889 RepID=A0A921NYB6_9RHOB|nr:MerR-type HTH domain containing protein [Profundibacterium mesophilum KAUST100406-0324]
MEKSPDAFRTISEVADWLDVPTHVLRFWESRFTQIKPVKRAGGRRYYRPADMELLGGIKRLLHDDGLTIRGVQKLLREDGVKHVSSLSAPLGIGEEPAQDAGPPPVPKHRQQPAPARTSHTAPPAEDANVVQLQPARPGAGRSGTPLELADGTPHRAFNEDHADLVSSGNGRGNGGRHVPSQEDQEHDAARRGVSTAFASDAPEQDPADDDPAFAGGDPVLLAALEIAGAASGRDALPDPAVIGQLHQRLSALHERLSIRQG